MESQIFQREDLKVGTAFFYKRNYYRIVRINTPIYKGVEYPHNATYDAIRLNYASDINGDSISEYTFKEMESIVTSPLHWAY